MFEREFVCFDFGVVEDVVDQRQRPFAGQRCMTGGVQSGSCNSGDGGKFIVHG